VPPGTRVANRSRMPTKHAHVAEPTHVRGRILSLNISPKGNVEGVLVDTREGPVQVNLPKHAGSTLTSSFQPGAKIDLTTEPEDERGDHPVHRLLATEDEARGTVARLNYARHGEVNGFHLTNGLFIHLKPEGAARHDVHVGETVKVTGARHVGADATVVEAKSVERLRRRPRSS
jgi:hypothetical protein